MTKGSRPPAGFFVEQAPAPKFAHFVWPAVASNAAKAGAPIHSGSHNCTAGSLFNFQVMYQKVPIARNAEECDATDDATENNG